MNIETMFFISLTLTIIGFIIFIINMLSALLNKVGREFKRIFIIHIIASLFYGLGGLGTIGFGIVWILTYLKH